MANNSYIQDRRGVGNRCRILAVIFGLISVVYFVKGSVFIGLILLGFALHLGFMGDRISRPPVNNPARFLLKFRTMSPIRPVLVCIGDSLTHGTVSDDWIPKVPVKVAEKMKFDRPEPSDFMDPVWIVNAGQNGMPSWVAFKERIQHAIACYPDYIMVMIGSNDVAAMYSTLHSLHEAVTWSLPEVCKMSVLERNLISILDTISERSPSTEIGICTIPPMGEDLSSPVNRLVKEANQIIHNIVEAREGEKCSVLEVNERMQSEIAKSGTRKRLPPEMSPFLSAVFVPLHYYLGIPWQLLSSAVGNRVLSDGGHLNEVGGDIVADVATEWLFAKNIHKAIAVKQFS